MIFSHDLLQQIASSPFAVNPEQAVRHSDVVNSNRLSLFFDTDRLEGPCVHHESDRKMVIGIPFLERLWGRSFAYTTFWDDRVFRTYGRRPPPNHSESMQFATDWITWSIAADKAAAKSDADMILDPSPRRLLPLSLLPVPSPNRIVGDSDFSATEVFLLAVSFLCHHEIAHLVLGHSPWSLISPTDNRQQELDADRYAAAEILRPLDNPTDPRFIKRSLAISTALAAETSIALHRRVSSSTHPPSWDRLTHTLDALNLPPDHVAWWWCTVVLALHNHIAGSPLVFDGSGYTFPRDFVQNMADQMANARVW